MIRKRRNRTRQPPQGVQLGRLYRSCALSCLVGDAGDIVSRAGWGYPEKKISKNGRGVGLSTQNSSSGTTLLSNSSIAIPTGSQFTLIYINDTSSSALSATLAVGQAGSGGTAEFNCYLPYSGDGKAYFRWGGEVDGVTSVSATASGNAGGWILTVGPRGMEIWQNGVRIASNTATPSRATSSAALITVNNSAPRAQSIPLLATFNKQFSPGVTRALARNPWRIFKSHRRPYALPSGGGSSAVNRSRWYYEQLGHHAHV